MANEDNPVDKVIPPDQEEAVSKVRELPGHAGKVLSLLAIAWAAFQLYTATFGFFEAYLQRSIHLAIALMVVFLMYAPTRRSSKDGLPLHDILLCLAGAATAVYIILDFDRLVGRWQYVDPVTSLDLIFGTLLIVLLLEATRRVVGLPLTLLGIAFLLFGYFGAFLPGTFRHKGFPLWWIVDQMYMGTDGIYGIPTGVSSTYAFTFIMFGAFLHRSGAGAFFIQLATALAGRWRGGPAKVGVISSAFFGTISGASTVNVFATGSFTIPMMKRLGYGPAFAGAVEATASTGGQIMPPVMGVAVFIMVELTGINYLEIIKMAAIPAVLYFLAVFMMVDFEAAEVGLRGMPKEELPDLRRVLKQGFHHFIPPIGLVYVLLLEYTAVRASLIGIALVVLVSLPRKSTRMGLWDILGAMESGAKQAVMIATACAAAGIAVGAMNMTGIGFKFASAIISASGGSLFLALVLTMITSIILGMGLPTTASYIIVAALSVPALVKMGVPEFPAHMFAFYFGCISSITPPVALAAFAGASLAGSDPMRTGFIASRLGIAGFIVPFMFVYGKGILLMAPVSEIIMVTASSAIGVIVLASAVQGWLLQKARIPDRLLLVASAAGFLKPGLLTSAVGAVLFGLAMWVQWYRIRTARASIYQTVENPSLAEPKEKENENDRDRR